VQAAVEDGVRAGETALVTITGAPDALRSTAERSMGSVARSALVSTITGSAPLSNDSTSSRSSLRRFGPFSND